MLPATKTVKEDSRCGKWRYRTELDARMAMAQIRDKDNPNRQSSECRVYFCGPCRAFHLAGARKWREKTLVARSVKRSLAKKDAMKPVAIDYGPEESARRVNRILEQYPDVAVARICRLTGLDKPAVKAVLRERRKAELDAMDAGPAEGQRPAARNLDGAGEPAVASCLAASSESSASGAAPSGWLSAELAGQLEELKQKLV